MKSKEYWEGRFIDLQRSQLKRADSFAHELEDLHARMQKEIDDDITVWHKKVATANGISMADAKKLMSRKDRKEFQWTLEEYEQHAKADLLSGVTSANVMNASANWHLSYLDGMKLQLEHHVDKLYKNIDSKTRNHFKESLNENYLNTAFELQKGIGIGEKMEVPYDERKLENILRTPWASDGKNFSQRIWKDRTQLVNNLQRNLSESVIRGDSDTDMIQALSKDEKKAEFNTRRLVETESAFFDSESERQCCEDFGVEKYRFLAVLDMKTSDICQELDNKVFLEKERQVGVNAPPMHPFCRSTTAPVIDEDFLTSRRAKNPKTGEYDEIPPDMNYKQWKEKYVEGKENVEEVKQEQVKTDTPNGAEVETKPLEQNTSEGETIHKDTAVPPKEEKFDSEVYENRVKKQAEKRVEKRIQKSKRKSDFINEKPLRTKEEDIKIKHISENLQNLGVKNIFFDDINYSFAKTYNRCLTNIHKEVPDLLKEIKAVGTISSLQNNLIEKIKGFYIRDCLKFNYIIDENIIKSIKEDIEDYFISSFKFKEKNVYAFYFKDNVINIKNLKEENTIGIYIFQDKIINFEKEYKNSGSISHPPNCFTREGVINHELGHALYKFLKIDTLTEEELQKNNLKTLEKIFNENRNVSLEEYLCDYPFDLRKIEEKLNKDFSISTEEFFAEAVSEGLTNHKVEILFNKEKLENSNVKSVVKQVFSLIIYQYGKYKK